MLLDGCCDDDDIEVRCRHGVIVGVTRFVGNREKVAQFGKFFPVQVAQRRYLDLRMRGECFDQFITARKPHDTGTIFFHRCSRY